MDFTFKKAAPGELDLVLSYLKEAAESLQDKGLEQWNIWLDPAEENVLWIREGVDAGEFYFVENEEEEKTGMFRLSYQDLLYWGAREDKAAYIHSLVVRRTSSGRSLGQKIISLVEKKLLKEGVHLLRLDCNAGNSWLCNYYEQLGFVKAGEKQMPHSLNNLYEKII